MGEANTLPAVFVSYSRADNTFVNQLSADLTAHGLSTWVDREGILPGTPDWEEALRRAIRGARAVLLIATPNSRSSRYVKDELRIAEMYQRPIYPLWIAGDHWMDCVPLGWGGTQYIDAREGRYEQAVQTILGTLKNTPSPELPPADPPSKMEDATVRNPFKGLRAFTSADARDFFGRKSLVKELTEALQQALLREQQGDAGERLLAVLGASGSGKSSAVMAGLLPSLRAGELPESADWVCLDPLVPGVHPIESLTLALSTLQPEKSLKMIREDLEDDAARGLHLHACALVKRQAGENPRLLLVIDQFEELFTLTATEEERRHFIDLLVTAITEPHGPVIAVLTMRADFSDRPMNYPELYHLIDAHHCSVLPMNLKELRAVIEQPALLPDVQLTFEGDLVGDLLFEVQGQVGALPLLEFTLDQLFQQRRGNTLTLEGYQQMGGVKGALVTHAEATYAALPSDEQRAAARALFLRLIDPGETEQDTTRRRAAISELSLSDPKRTRVMRETITAFISARLLTTNEVTGTVTIEVSHEALIREWTRLADWVRTGREDVRLQRAISEDVEQWERYGKPGDRLYRGSQLKDAKAWAARSMPSGREMAFLQACTDYQKRIRVRTAATLLSLALLLVLITGVAEQLFFSRLADYTHVTSLNDTGQGSLFAAIQLAHNGSTITIDKNLRGVIHLNADLTINKNLTIVGPGATMLAVSSGSHSYRIRVDEGMTVNITGLAFKDSTVMNIPPFDTPSFINNFGKLTLKNCVISGNASVEQKGVLGTGGHGGGITNNGTLFLIDSTVSHNTASGGYDGNGGYGGGIANNGTLSLVNSTVSDNLADASISTVKKGVNGGGSGGGITNSGNLTLTNSLISHNTAAGGTNSKDSFDTVAGGSGGGISNTGALVINNSIVADNSALSGVGSPNGSDGGHGGGIDSQGVNADYGATIKISNSTIANNIAAGSGSGNGGCGGGISNMLGNLTIIGSTIAGNRTSGGSVGNDNVRVGGSYITVCATSLVGSTSYGGGGIANLGGYVNDASGTVGYAAGTLTLINSTITGNTSTSSGGGIIDWGSKTDITFCTFYDNKAFRGGNIAAEKSYNISYDNNNKPVAIKPFLSQVALTNSIVANRGAQSGSVMAGQFTSGGYNLLQRNSGATFIASKQLYTDILVDDASPVLGDNPMLQQDRGSTRTYALLPGTGNPALGKVPLLACHVNNITTDQRGVKRPMGNKATCDIGAYEVD